MKGRAPRAAVMIKFARPTSPASAPLQLSPFHFPSLPCIQISHRLQSRHGHNLTCPTLLPPLCHLHVSSLTAPLSSSSDHATLTPRVCNLWLRNRSPGELILLFLIAQLQFSAACGVGSCKRLSPLSSPCCGLISLSYWLINVHGISAAVCGMWC